jgi:hypothetical protein
MNIYKGIAHILFFSILLGSCFEAPEFSDVPEISNAEVKFIEVKDQPGQLKADTLAVSINFKDGNGDLGLGEEEVDDPFHPRNYFVEDGNGGLIKVSTTNRYVDAPPVLIPSGKGKLITHRTRSKTGYGDLPAFSSSDLGCVNYAFDSVLVAETDKSLLDNSYNILDTLLDRSANLHYYLVRDTLYFERNENHYNITVRFFVKDSNNNFSEFSWEDEYCSTFNGRFPFLSDRDNVPLEGTLRYTMNSTGFLFLFGSKPLKLRIQIKDRVLNKSNEIETQEFTLK